MNPPLDIATCAIAVSALQSVLGVGVLLFGTLLLDYPFAEIVAILLPVSIGVSLLQLGRGWRQVDLRFLVRALLHAAPVIAMLLVAALTRGKSLGLCVAALLLLYAMKGISRPLEGRSTGSRATRESDWWPPARCAG